MNIKKSFYFTALMLALPNVIQQLVTNLSQMVDNLMVGRLQEVAIAGVSISNQVFFIFTTMLLGLAATGGIFIAQYKGAKNEEKITEVFRVVILFSFLVGVVFFLLMHFIPDKVFGIFAKDSATIESAISYVKYIKYTFLIYPISIAVGSSYRFIGLVKTPMYVSIVSVIANVIFNYLLIYGNFGFPALGVPGAALATLIARVIEFVILVYLTRHIKSPIVIHLKKTFQFELYILKDYLNKGYGLIGNEFFWAFGMQLIIVLYTNRISENIAAMSIATVMTNMIFIGMGGMSVAISIIVGNSLGQGEFEQAKKDSKKLLRLCAGVGLSLGVSILFMSYFMTMLYDISPDTLKMSRLVIVVATCFSWLYYLNAGHFFILRAGGDTKSVLIMDSGFVWLITIPFAFFIGKLGIYLPLHYLIVQFADLLKLAVARYRYQKGTWLNNLTIQSE
ncbi:putative MATE family efflux protein [Bacilli bacterium PM5-3]|nr:putative MATE family efflux protein [Bacilli bacterium PM5-3]MDH6603148.1 putative MATE family efflux protein [Bacilli bacterium PM5-9]